VTEIALIRHGPTAWNEAGRIQGRRDISLSQSGREAVAGWRLPACLARFAWISSPLSRALETARLLGAPEPIATDARLVEMDWGIWEGQTLAALIAENSPAWRDGQDKGSDFRPPDGESPRDVQARVRSWLDDIGSGGKPTIAVVHKGVIRATYALATGWDMMREPPDKLTWSAAHLFRIGADGTPKVARLNIELTAP